MKSGRAAMVKSLGPIVTRRMQAPATARPATSDVAPDVVLRFLANHEQTIERIRLLGSGVLSDATTGMPWASVYFRWNGSSSSSAGGAATLKSV